MQMPSPCYFYKGIYRQAAHTVDRVNLKMTDFKHIRTLPGLRFAVGLLVDNYFAKAYN